VTSGSSARELSRHRGVPSVLALSAHRDPGPDTAPRWQGSGADGRTLPGGRVPSKHREMTMSGRSRGPAAPLRHWARIHLGRTGPPRPPPHARSVMAFNRRRADATGYTPGWELMAADGPDGMRAMTSVFHHDHQKGTCRADSSTRTTTWSSLTIETMNARPHAVVRGPDRQLAGRRLGGLFSRDGGVAEDRQGRSARRSERSAQG